MSSSVPVEREKLADEEAVEVADLFADAYSVELHGEHWSELLTNEQRLHVAAALRTHSDTPVPTDEALARALFEVIAPEHRESWDDEPDQTRWREYAFGVLAHLSSRAPVPDASVQERAAAECTCAAGEMPCGYHFASCPRSCANIRGEVTVPDAVRQPDGWVVLEGATEHDAHIAMWRNQQHAEQQAAYRRIFDKGAKVVPVTFGTPLSPTGNTEAES